MASVEKKILYSNTFCAYRDKYQGRIICRHMYGYGTCDLDLCPIVNSYFANIIFREDGIYLVVKKPSEEYIAGKWEQIKLEAKMILDNPDEVKKFVGEKVNGIPSKMKQFLFQRLENIYKRWKFLQNRKKIVGILESKEREEKPIEELEKIEEEVISGETIEEELSKELEKIEESKG